MQIVYHLGVHGTDGDRMLKTLLSNRVWLLKNRTEIVTPNRHRGIFDEALAALNGGASTPDMEQLMMDAVLESDAPRRVICSTASFLGVISRAVSPDGLYPQAGSRIAALANLFPSARSEFFVALKNPATLIADVVAQAPGGDYAAVMQGIDPLSLRWRPAVQRMAQGAQGRRLVVWCHEDVPLIWPDLVRMIGDMPPDVPLGGALLYMQELLGDRGLQQLRAAMAGRDQLSVAARREIFSEHLTRHAVPDALDQTLDLPGWSQEMVDRISRQYREDMAQIAVMPGVEFMAP